MSDEVKADTDGYVWDCPDELTSQCIKNSTNKRQWQFHEKGLQGKLRFIDISSSQAIS